MVYICKKKALSGETAKQKAIKNDYLQGKEQGSESVMEMELSRYFYVVLTLESYKYLIDSK